MDGLQRPRDKSQLLIVPRWRLLSHTAVFPHAPLPGLPDARMVMGRTLSPLGRGHSQMLRGSRRSEQRPQAPMTTMEMGHPASPFRACLGSW
jgi:hypothetical protein